MLMRSNDSNKKGVVAGSHHDRYFINDMLDAKPLKDEYYHSFLATLKDDCIQKR